MCGKIRDSTDYQTVKKKKEAMLLYYLHTVPQPSWQTVAGASYGMYIYITKEVTALEAVKVFLKHTPGQSSLQLYCTTCTYTCIYMILLCGNVYMCVDVYNTCICTYKITCIDV